MLTYRKILPWFLLLFLFLFLRMGLAGLTGFAWDNHLWAEWAAHTRVHGLQKAYVGSGTDYPPLYQYFLWLFAKINGDPALIEKRIYYLRIFTLAFEFLSLWLVADMTGRRKHFLDVCILSVLNVAFFYNTVIWGQVDGLLAALVIASVYTAWKRWYVLSACCLVLCLSFKIQGIVFLPLWLLLWTYGLRFEKRWWLKGGLGLIAAALLQYLIVLPFIQSAESTAALKDAVFGAVGRYPFVTLNAYNMWYWLIPGNPRFYYDGQAVLFGLTRKQWGLLLFFASSALALWPLVKEWLSAFRRQATYRPLNAEKIFLAGALVALLFFFVNTQMHERYSHPAFIFLLALALQTNDFKPYLLFSLAYFLNLEGVLQWFNIKNHFPLPFRPPLVAGLFLLLIGMLFYKLYRRRMPGADHPLNDRLKSGSRIADRAAINSKS